LVYRCDKTYAQDTTPSAVILTNATHFVSLKSAALNFRCPRRSGSTYQTEIANLPRSREWDSRQWSSLVLCPSKRRTEYTYGGTADSQVLATGTGTASSWLLNEVSDRDHNRMTIHYDQQRHGVPTTFNGPTTTRNRWRPITK